jgi:quinol monooxygenase YgiN
MSDQAVTVLAKVKAKEGMADKVRAECLSLVGPTRGEKGCISYDFHELIDGPGEFMFYEQWECKADLDVHIQQPHLQRFIGMSEQMLAAPLQVSIFKKLT